MRKNTKHNYTVSLYFKQPILKHVIIVQKELYGGSFNLFFFI